MGSAVSVYVYRVCVRESLSISVNYVAVVVSAGCECLGIVVKDSGRAGVTC